MFDLSLILSFEVIGLCLLGVVLGIIFGFLPGLSATMGVAIMMPFTFGMDPIPSFALLLGVYVGGIYGGSITAILIRTPGTPASAATVLDGYPMSQQHRGREALSAATLGSFIGGIFSCVVLILLARQVANFALKFGPPEYFAVGMFGLSIVSSLAGKNILKGIIAACIGLMLGTIGMDPVTGAMRFTFGITGMLGGIQLVAALVGLFAVSEVISKLAGMSRAANITEVHVDNSKIVSAKTLLKNWVNLLRSSIIGTVIGIIPGTGSGTASWLSYNEAKRVSKSPETFGKGNIEGLLASEVANNAVTGGALVPLLTLGVPGDAVTAVLLGSLMIQGLTPGPTLFTDSPDVVNGIYIMLVIANIFMCILGLLGVPLFVKVLKVPSGILMSCVLVLCAVGSYAIRNNLFDVGAAMLLGVVGYLLIRADFPIPPILLGLILGSMIESNYRRAMTMSKGDPSIFFTRPICLVLLVVAVIAFCWPFIRSLLAKRRAAKSGEKT